MTIPEAGTESVTRAITVKRLASPVNVLWQFCRAKPLGAAGGVLVLLLVLLALLAGVIAPYHPNEQHAADAVVGPSSRYLLGTDSFGRDQLSRIIYGARVSLKVGLIAVGIGVGAGTVLGVISGFFKGAVDSAIQGVMDALMAFPGLVLAMILVAVLGTSIVNVMIAIGVTFIPTVCRVARGSVLSVSENAYIEAARSIGVPAPRLLLVHILPNVAAPLIIIATAGLGGAILTEAGLSFLGLGTQPPDPSWGQMLSTAAGVMQKAAPWLTLYPGIAITLSVLGFNLLGDALRDVWDPRLRGT
jgi:peptide/nickel transport system permease protein